MSAASDSFAAGATPSQCSSLVVSSAMAASLSSILDASGYDAEDTGANGAGREEASHVRGGRRKREKQAAGRLGVREEEKIGLGHARRDLQDWPRRREVAAGAVGGDPGGREAARTGEKRHGSRRDLRGDAATAQHLPEVS